MPWHRVIIKHSANAHLSAQGLMIPFVQQYKEAGAPEGVAVYMSRDEEGIGRIIFPPMPRRLRKTCCIPFTPRVALPNPIWRAVEKFGSKCSPMDALPSTFIRE